MYTVQTAYNDGTTKIESCNYLPSVLTAIAIYYEDPDFFCANIWYTDTGEIIASFKKD